MTNIIHSTISEREDIARTLKDFAGEVHAHDPIMWRAMVEAADQLVDANSQIQEMMNVGNRMYDVMLEAMDELGRDAASVMMLRIMNRAMADWEQATDMDTYGRS